MKVGFAADHAGFDLKETLLQALEGLDYECVDFGPAPDPLDDYPDFAQLLGEAILRGDIERGILICGSGVGACVAANKISGIRAGICHDAYSAHQGVEHDDMNILVLGSRIIGVELAKDLMQEFLRARFTNEPRHRRRLEKVKALEGKSFSR